MSDSLKPLVSVEKDAGAFCWPASSGLSVCSERGVAFPPASYRAGIEFSSGARFTRPGDVKYGGGGSMLHAARDGGYVTHNGHVVKIYYPPLNLLAVPIRARGRREKRSDTPTTLPHTAAPTFYIVTVSRRQRD